jgi:hypothetical protein
MIHNNERAITINSDHTAMTMRREKIGMVDLSLMNPPELNLTFTPAQLWSSKIDNKTCIMKINPLILIVW